jgi:hypothetical protein
MAVTPTTIARYELMESSNDKGLMFVVGAYCLVGDCQHRCGDANETEFEPSLCGLVVQPIYHMI